MIAARYLEKFAAGLMYVQESLPDRSCAIIWAPCRPTGGVPVVCADAVEVTRSAQASAQVYLTERLRIMAAPLLAIVGAISRGVSRTPGGCSPSGQTLNALSEGDAFVCFFW